MPPLAGGVRYVTLDVFTPEPFGGNQLAVFPDARGIPERALLPVTREFNFSETTFVYPPDDARHTRRVRIFTPGGEIPFAGHPTVGTAHALAELGEIALTGATTRIVFEEGVGPVPVTIRAEEGRAVFAQLTAARRPEIVPAAIPDAAALAGILSLDAGDLALGEWMPEVRSCGIAFLFVRVRDRAAVARARVRTDRWERTLAGTPASEISVFAGGGERPGSDLHVRVFVPGLSVPEDAATGGAAAAMAGYLGARDPRRDGTLRWVLEQGFEMGRPSIIELEADKVGNMVTAVRVGGASVMMSEGRMRIPA